MKKNLYFLLPFAVLVACSQAGTLHDHADHTGHEHAEHSEAGAAPVVQLDSGKTWAANTETTEGVQAMKALVETSRLPLLNCCTRSSRLCWSPLRSRIS